MGKTARKSEEDVKFLSDADNERISEYKDMMVPVLAVVSSFFLVLVAVVTPVTVAIVAIISAVKYL